MKRVRLVIDVPAVLPVILEIRIRDSGRGGDEKRPRIEFFRERIVEQNESPALGLLRD
jgi:hypothetical protein